jgi:hypothetical protein
MKAVLCLTILLAICARADEVSDRGAIRDLMADLNHPDQHPLADLFTADADRAEQARLAYLVRRLEERKRPWSETATPAIIARSVRFVTAEVALVDATYAPYGAVFPGSPMLFVLKKVATVWRIASVRELSEDSTLPRFLASSSSDTAAPSAARHPR